MSEIGDDFAALREVGKQKRARNEEWSINFLSQKGISFTILQRELSAL